MLKVFFEKLKSELKNNKVKYFFAHGKDNRIGNLYTKLCNGVNSLKTLKTNTDKKLKSSEEFMNCHKTAVFAKI